MCWLTLISVFLCQAVIQLLLLLAGDVEQNPGPPKILKQGQWRIQAGADSPPPPPPPPLGERERSRLELTHIHTGTQLAKYF